MAKLHGSVVRVWCIALHGALLLASQAHADDGGWGGWDGWAGSIGAATDYVYRGVTQTNGGPVVQGGLHAQLRGGWSAGVWGSTVELNPNGERNYELDLHATRAWSLTPDWTATLGYTRYEYLSDDGVVDYDRDELRASISFQQRLTAVVSWSPNTSRYRHAPVRGSATAYELTFLQPLDARWSLFAGAGRHDLRDVLDEDYYYWSAGLTFTWSSLQVDAAYIGADRTAQRLFGDQAGSRWTGALSVRF